MRQIKHDGSGHRSTGGRFDGFSADSFQRYVSTTWSGWGCASGRCTSTGYGREAEELKPVLSVRGVCSIFGRGSG